jgi:hypothetical protein
MTFTNLQLSRGQYYFLFENIFVEKWEKILYVQKIGRTTIGAKNNRSFAGGNLSKEPKICWDPNFILPPIFQGPML